MKESLQSPSSFTLFLLLLASAKLWTKPKPLNSPITYISLVMCPLILMQ